MEYYTEFLWEKNARDTNEDSLAINQVLINGNPLLMAVVCDGIGSLSDGELASSYVVGCLKAQFDLAGRERKMTLRRLEHRLCRCLFQCHEELLNRNTGTTVCAVLIYGRRAILISMGDSRIYMGNGKMRLMTKDTADDKGRLTAAIGVGNYKGIQKKKRIIKTSTRILICSDGFYRRNEEKICNGSYFGGRKNEDQMRTVLEEIYSDGVNKGEKDNASAVAIWRR